MASSAGSNRLAPGIAPGRLTDAEYAENFGDLHPPLTSHEASVAADRCYFCFDAPCVQACPTEIDIPLFIRQIATGQPEGAAKTIFDQNIMGGMCARVCPTETLCEQACVREHAEGKPVEIGRLQRFATDVVMARDEHPYDRAPASGKKIAVLGAGPAGLACAHRLAMHGHDIVIFEAKPKPGGLNEYGIAAYKTVEGFAQAEVDWLLKIGGIRIEYGNALGIHTNLGELRDAFDAVFVGVGLGDTNELGIEGDNDEGVRDAVDFVADLRQAEDLAALSVGRRVVVIGGGMTAIDAAVQSKLLGAEEVTIAYRREPERMSASRYEQDLATSKGVRIRHQARPTRIDRTDDGLKVSFERTDGSGETFAIATDQLFRAIGQTLELAEELTLNGRKINVDDEGRTSIAGIWAGGDCVAAGDDLTVTAVAQGRDAATSIHRTLMGKG
ncbi:MAG: NAD(P)-dependent oxidoreductase [Pseudomonadota bacterium]